MKQSKKKCDLIENQWLFDFGVLEDEIRLGQQNKKKKNLKYPSVIVTVKTNEFPWHLTPFLIQIFLEGNEIE